MQWKTLQVKQWPEGTKYFIEYLQGAIQHAKKRKLRIDKVYNGRNSSETARVQREIILGTRELKTHFCGMGHLNMRRVTQNDLENALDLLGQAKTLFSNHPFNNVLFGRIVYITNEAHRAGLNIGEEYKGLIGRRLKSYQDPSINYFTPKAVKKSIIKIYLLNGELNSKV